MANTCDSHATVDKRKSRKKRSPEDWRGQIGMGVGEQKRRVEPEASVLARVKEALWAVGGVHVMRNSVGGVKKGSRFIRYGLEPSSSDLVAIVAPYGRWLCIECKNSAGGNGVEEVEQAKWLAKMRTYGAVAGFCTTPEQALALVEEARRAP